MLFDVATVDGTTTSFYWAPISWASSAASGGAFFLLAVYELLGHDDPDASIWRHWEVSGRSCELSSLGRTLHRRPDSCAIRQAIKSYLLLPLLASTSDAVNNSGLGPGGLIKVGTVFGVKAKDVSTASGKEYVGLELGRAQHPSVIFFYIIARWIIIVGDNDSSSLPPSLPPSLMT